MSKEKVEELSPRSIAIRRFGSTHRLMKNWEEIAAKYGNSKDDDVIDLKNMSVVRNRADDKISEDYQQCHIDEFPYFQDESEDGYTSKHDEKSMAGYSMLSTKTVLDVLEETAGLLKNNVKEEDVEDSDGETLSSNDDSSIDDDSDDSDDSSRENLYEVSLSSRHPVTRSRRSLEVNQQHKESGHKHRGSTHRRSSHHIVSHRLRSSSRDKVKTRGHKTRRSRSGDGFVTLSSLSHAKKSHRSQHNNHHKSQPISSLQSRRSLHKHRRSNVDVDITEDSGIGRQSNLMQSVSVDNTRKTTDIVTIDDSLSENTDSQLTDEETVLITDSDVSCDSPALKDVNSRMLDDVKEKRVPVNATYIVSPHNETRRRIKPTLISSATKQADVTYGKQDVPGHGTFQPSPQQDQVHIPKDERFLQTKDHRLSRPLGLYTRNDPIVSREGQNVLHNNEARFTNHNSQPSHSAHDYRGDNQGKRELHTNQKVYRYQKPDNDSTQSIQTLNNVVYVMDNTIHDNTAPVLGGELDDSAPICNNVLHVLDDSYVATDSSGAVYVIKQAQNALLSPSHKRPMNTTQQVKRKRLDNSFDSPAASYMVVEGTAAHYAQQDDDSGFVHSPMLQTKVTREAGRPEDYQHAQGNYDQNIAGRLDFVNTERDHGQNLHVMTASGLPQQSYAPLHINNQYKQVEMSQSDLQYSRLQDADVSRERLLAADAGYCDGDLEFVPAYEAVPVNVVFEQNVFASRPHKTSKCASRPIEITPVSSPPLYRRTPVSSPPLYRRATTQVLCNLENLQHGARAQPEKSQLCHDNTYNDARYDTHASEPLMSSPPVYRRIGAQGVQDVDRPAREVCRQAGYDDRYPDTRQDRLSSLIVPNSFARYDEYGESAAASSQVRPRRPAAVPEMTAISSNGHINHTYEERLSAELLQRSADGPGNARNQAVPRTPVMQVKMEPLTPKRRADTVSETPTSRRPSYRATFRPHSGHSVSRDMQESTVMQCGAASPVTPSRHLRNLSLNTPTSHMNQINNTPTSRMNQVINIPTSRMNQVNNTPTSCMNQDNTPTSHMNQVINTPTSCMNQVINTPTSGMNQGKTSSTRRVNQVYNTPTSRMNQVNTPTSRMNQDNTPTSHMNQVNTPTSRMNQVNSMPTKCINQVDNTQTSHVVQFNNTPTSRMNQVNTPTSHRKQISNIPGLGMNKINNMSPSCMNQTNDTPLSHTNRPNNTTLHTSHVMNTPPSASMNQHNGTQNEYINQGCSTPTTHMNQRNITPTSCVGRLSSTSTSELPNTPTSCMNNLSLDESHTAVHGAQAESPGSVRSIRSGRCRPALRFLPAMERQSSNAASTVAPPSAMSTRGWRSRLNFQGQVMSTPIKHSERPSLDISAIPAASRPNLQKSRNPSEVTAKQAVSRDKCQKAEQLGSLNKEVQQGERHLPPGLPDVSNQPATAKVSQWLHKLPHRDAAVASLYNVQNNEIISRKGNHSTRSRHNHDLQGKNSTRQKNKYAEVKPASTRMETQMESRTPSQQKMPLKNKQWKDHYENLSNSSDDDFIVA